MAVFPVHTRIRMGGRDPDEDHRAATPLELLFDLTFVVAFGIAADEFAPARRGARGRGAHRSDVPVGGVLVLVELADPVIAELRKGGTRGTPTTSPSGTGSS